MVCRWLGILPFIDSGSAAIYCTNTIRELLFHILATIIMYYTAGAAELRWDLLLRLLHSLQVGMYG